MLYLVILLLLVGISGAVFLVILWYLYLIKCMWPLRDVPGPKPLPIIGCSYLFPNVKSMLSGFTFMTQAYGPICKMMIGVEPSLLISDYQTLEAILRSSKLIEKSKSYRHFYNWLGFGLLTSGGSKWRARRKLLTPSYHFKILDGFLPVFDSVSSNLVQALKKEVGKDSVDVYPYITLCTLDIICETAMGISVDALIKQDSEYVQAVKGMCNVVMEKVFSPLQHHKTTFKYTKNFKLEKQLLKTLNDYTMNVIKRRREEMECTHILTNNLFEDQPENKKIPFLDLLLQTRIDDKPLSDEDLREEVQTFMFEGHDTTASAISFALYSIANHPEVQQKIVQELQNIFAGDSIRMTTSKDLNEMKYLELVIKETLRLYPSVPFYGRETKENVQIGKLNVPKNFTLIIFAMGIQRDPQFYDEPLKFIPERFINKCNEPYSFIPFSAGHRNCIGQKFAMLEMKATLSKILRNFELFPSEPNEEMCLISETILKSANGIKIRLEKRNFE